VEPWNGARTRWSLIVGRLGYIQRVTQEKKRFRGRKSAYSSQGGFEMKVAAVIQLLMELGKEARSAKALA
jgi:hypothetical protein